jgi:hypothetical protein
MLFSCAPSTVNGMLPTNSCELRSSATRAGASPSAASRAEERKVCWRAAARPRVAGANARRSGAGAKRAVAHGRTAATRATRDTVRARARMLAAGVAVVKDIA